MEKKNKTKAMTLILNDREMEALEQLCETKGLSKTALIRQCLRFYQLVDQRIKVGDKLYFEDEKKEKSELFLL